MRRTSPELQARRLAEQQQRTAETITADALARAGAADERAAHAEQDKEAAQRSATEAIEAAERDAAARVAEAKRLADEQVEQAQRDAAEQVRAAQEHAQTTIRDARTEADAQIRTVREEAERQVAHARELVKDAEEQADADVRQPQADVRGAQLAQARAEQGQEDARRTLERAEQAADRERETLLRSRQAESTHSRPPATRTPGVPTRPTRKPAGNAPPARTWPHSCAPPSMAVARASRPAAQVRLEAKTAVSHKGSSPGGKVPLASEKYPEERCVTCDRYSP